MLNQIVDLGGDGDHQKLRFTRVTDEIVDRAQFIDDAGKDEGNSAQYVVTGYESVNLIEQIHFGDIH